MRISDWSSDVCSSDLFLDLKARQPSRSSHAAAIAARYSATAVAPNSQYASPPMIRMAPSRSKGLEMKNGAPKTVRTKRAAVTANGATATYNQTSDRKSVVAGKSVSVGVDLGGRRIMKKKMVNKKNVI